MQPNRLERYWGRLSSDILSKWDGLSKYDLNGIGGDYDGLVEVIRKRCFPSRSKLSIEGEIRDWLTASIAELEKEES